MPHSTAYHIDKNWPFAKTINTPSLLLLCSISHASLTPTDRYSTSVQVAREPIISSSLLVIVWNKHEWTSEGIVSTMERFQCTPFFKFKSTDINLLSCLFCLFNKVADSGLWLVNKTPIEGSIPWSHTDQTIFPLFSKSIKPLSMLIFCFSGF